MSKIPEEIMLLHNLKDAGCDEKTIQKFLRMQEEGRKQEQYRLLALHRAALLNQMHISQHRIDCLDYLIYTMKKEETRNN